jgi:hypothetical protein
MIKANYRVEQVHKNRWFFGYSPRHAISSSTILIEITLALSKEFF